MKNLASARRRYRTVQEIDGTTPLAHPARGGRAGAMRNRTTKGELRVSTQQNRKIVHRIYDELCNERKLEVADEAIARGGVNYDTGLVPMPLGPEDLGAMLQLGVIADSGFVPGPPIYDERSARAWRRASRGEVM